MSDIDKELSRTLEGQFTLATTLDLDTRHRYAILSDQHKGAGDEADEFRKCRDAYVAALEHYRANGFALVLLGDVEELWEQGFKSVRHRYEAVLQLEGSFESGRYYRVWGNHDDKWMGNRAVAKHLTPYMPTGAVYEGLRFEVEDNGEPLGRILMLHGHQGTFASDKLRGVARFALKFYRILQRVLPIGRTTPAKDACLRGSHDRDMYEWAARQNKLILIAGHTHRPVWCSQTHLEKLREELRLLEAQPASPERDEHIARKKREIERRTERAGECNDVPKTKPCYFNTGCCKYDDGDITGIEVDNGTMRLIKWSAPEDGSKPQRILLEQGLVRDIFRRL